MGILSEGEIKRNRKIILREEKCNDLKLELRLQLRQRLEKG